MAAMESAWQFRCYFGVMGAALRLPFTAKTGVLNLTPVDVNRGPHPQVLTLHPRVST